MASVPAKTTKKAIEDHAPWRPPAYEEADAYAIQALGRGTANMDQQRRALAWIIEKAAATYDMSYRPGAGEGDRDTVFAEGRRFVGNQVVKMTKLKIGQRRSEQ
jgi:hypothetical protein